MMTATERSDSEMTRATTPAGASFSGRLWMLPGPVVALVIFTALLSRSPEPPAATPLISKHDARIPATAVAPVREPFVCASASADLGYGLYRESDSEFLGGWRAGSRAVWHSAPEPGRYAVVIDYHYAAGLGEKLARFAVRAGDGKVASFLAFSSEDAPPSRIKLGEIEVTSGQASVESELIEGPSEPTRLRVKAISFIPINNSR